MKAIEPNKEPLLDLETLPRLGPLREKDLPRYTGMPASFWRKLRFNGGGPKYHPWSTRTTVYYAGEVRDWIESRPSFTNTAQDRSPAARTRSRHMSAAGKKGGSASRKKPARGAR
jgi:hypothetical protein